MIAEILSVFSQMRGYRLLFHSTYEQVLMWLDMSRYIRYKTPIPERYKSIDVLPEHLPQMKKSDSFRDTHMHTPDKGWIKRIK